MKVSQSCLTLWTPWTVAHQAPLSMDFSRQVYWKWVAISFFSGSSWPGDQTLVPCIAGRFFTIWATKTPVKKCTLSIPKLFSTSAHFSTGFAEKWVAQWSILFLHAHFRLPLKYVIFKLHMKSLFFLWMYWLLTPHLSLNVGHAHTFLDCLCASFLHSYSQSQPSQSPDLGVTEGIGARQHHDLFLVLFNMCLLRIYHVSGTTLKLKGK